MMCLVSETSLLQETKFLPIATGYTRMHLV